MKRKKLIEFANWLANSRHKFKMSNNCDCIAGQAARFFGGKYGARQDADEFTLVQAFDLTQDQACTLFTANGVEARWELIRGVEPRYNRVTRKAAVAVLRLLAKTGKVRWAAPEVQKHLVG